MKVRFLEYVKWGELIFEAGEVYDVDEMFLARLQRNYKLVKEQGAVEQPDKPTLVDSEPAVTALPSPETDDLAMKPIKTVTKPKRK